MNPRQRLALNVAVSRKAHCVLVWITARTTGCKPLQYAVGTQTFDEMLLLKRGGSVIYNGPLGKQSKDMIAYFESLPGVDPIAEGYSAHACPYSSSAVAPAIHIFRLLDQTPHRDDDAHQAPALISSRWINLVSDPYVLELTLAVGHIDGSQPATTSRGLSAQSSACSMNVA